MQCILRVLTALAVICLLPASIMAVDSANGQYSAPKLFSLFGPDQNVSGQTVIDSKSAESQSDGSMSNKSDTDFKPMNLKNKWHFYLESVYGKKSFATSLAGAGIRQAMDSTPEWEQGMEGYSKRFGSGFGQKAIKRSVQFGLGILFHEDPRYFASKSAGIFPRAVHVVKEEFVSHRDSGGIRFGFTNLIATTTGVLVSRQWYPESERITRRYLSAIATSIALGAVKNAVKEFWPRKK
jgi:hypothetical protein